MVSCNPGNISCCIQNIGAWSPRGVARRQPSTQTRLPLQGPPSPRAPTTPSARHPPHLLLHALHPVPPPPPSIRAPPSHPLPVFNPHLPSRRGLWVRGSARARDPTSPPLLPRLDEPPSGRPAAGAVTRPASVGGGSSPPAHSPQPARPCRRAAAAAGGCGGGGGSGGVDGGDGRRRPLCSPMGGGSPPVDVVAPLPYRPPRGDGGWRRVRHPRGLLRRDGA